MYICIYIYIYTFNLMKTFGYPTSIGRWGFQDQGGCTPLPCLAGRCVSSIPSPRVQTPWNLSPACDSPGPRGVGVIGTSPKWACPKVVAMLNPRGIHAPNTPTHRRHIGGRSIGHLTHTISLWASSFSSASDEQVTRRPSCRALP